MASNSASSQGNTLSRLGAYTFSELERLEALDTADTETLELEIKRAKAVEQLVKAQVDVANATLDAVRLRAEFMGSQRVSVPRELLS